MLFFSDLIFKQAKILLSDFFVLRYTLPSHHDKNRTYIEYGGRFFYKPTCVAALFLNKVASCI